MPLDTPITVLMPVYNGGKHLAEAVASILAQTHSTLELLVIDDGSTDGSSELLDALSDSRVRVHHQKNRGLVRALNTGLALARHEVVARMDADDLSLPDRLMRQLEVLVEQPDVVAVSCCFEQMDEAGRTIGAVHVPADAAYLHRQLYFRNVLPHGAMMFRRADVLRIGGYRDVGPAEDYDLWSRLVAEHRIASVAQVLYRYRISATGVSQTSAVTQRLTTRTIRNRLHNDRPMAVPTPRQVMLEGSRVCRAQSACGSMDGQYLFDHTALTVLLARAGRRRGSAWLAVGVGLFAVTHPLSPLRLIRFLRKPPQA